MFRSIRSRIFLTAAILALAIQPALAAEVRIKLGQSKTVTLPLPDGKQTEISLEFSKIGSGVMLHVENPSKFLLTYKAVICLTKLKHCEKTSTIPVRPGLSSFEGWPPGGDVVILSDFKFGP